MKKIKNRFKEGSDYSNFEPKLCIVYYSVHGWNSGYNAFFTTDENHRNIDEPFYDEPTGKYAKNRKVINL